MGFAEGQVLPVSLAESPSSPRQRRWAAVFAAAIVLIAALSSFTVGRALPALNGPSFFTAYDTLSAAIAWVTAWLLTSQFEQTRSLRLLALAMAFTLAGALAAAHQLTIPGLLLQQPLFGNDNTTLWIRVIWLAAIPLGALKYLFAQWPALRDFCNSGGPRLPAVVGIALAATLAVVAIVVATSATDILPDLRPRPENFAITYYYVLPALITLQILALAGLWWQDRGRTALGLWLAVAVLAVLAETVIGWLLVGVWPDRRYSLNFFIARAFGLAADSVVFMALLAQIGRCYRQLADAGRALHGRIRELSASEARLVAIVSSTSEAILTKSLDGTITSWNRAAERLFGYAADEVVGRSIRELIPQSRQEDEDQVLGRIAASEALENYDTERIDKQGRAIEVSLTVSPLVVDGELLGASSIMHDISARRRREQETELLLKEVNHRSKNLLAVVQAIARQTAHRSTAEFLASFTERIEALAASHDLLVESRWQGVDLEQLVRAELGRFQELIGGRVVIEGPALRLSPHAAQTVGMTLHELATNAGKYGALSSELGRVTIRWRLASSNGMTTFQLGWSEQGGPPVVPPSRRGFGTVLTTDVPRGALRGRVELAYATSGFAWSLEAPVDAVLETHGPEPASETMLAFAPLL